MVINYRLIGQRIKARRVERGLTQENIAEYLNISVSYVSRVERAAVKISLETLVKIAIYLEIEVAYLIEGTVIASIEYLHSDLAETISGFTAAQMNLLLDMAKIIKGINIDSYTG